MLAPANGGDAVLLDQIAQARADLLAKHLAHQRAEGVHVLAKRFVAGRKVDLVAAHGESLARQPASSTDSACSSASGNP
jgi:hypothetical protein